jgi:carbonic anhydrase
MQKLLQGVQKFQAEVYRQKETLFQNLTDEGQHPSVLFITCSDSRIDPNLLTQTEPGELFVIRNSGNIVPPYTGQACGEAASIEYAVKVLGVEHVIICGHSHCGAIQHMLQHKQTPTGQTLPMVEQWLHFCETTRHITERHWHEMNEPQRNLYAIEANVLVQLRHLKTHPCVAEGLAAGSLSLYGWLYDMPSGGLAIYDEALDAFQPLSTETDVMREVSVFMQSFQDHLWQGKTGSYQCA